MNLADDGVRIRDFYPGIDTSAGDVLKHSCRSILWAIRRGITYKTKEEDVGAPEGTFLEGVQSGLRARGWSHSEIATRVGCTRQQVGKFMTADSVNTKTLERFRAILSEG